MIIAQEERRRQAVGKRQDLVPGGAEGGFVGFGDAGRAPVQEEFDIGEHFLWIVGAQARGDRQGMLMESH